MAFSKDRIRDAYSDPDREEGRASLYRRESLEFRYTKRLLHEHVGPDHDVLEIGCGTGYYGLYLAGKCRSYLGVDLSPQHIDRFRQRIAELELTGVTAQVGDSTHLFNIPDSSRDVVLLFGPLYHLPPEEREKAVAEAVRVCRGGGYILLHYLNQAGAYLSACIAHPQKYPNAATNHTVLAKGTDDLQPDVFFFTMPEEMEVLASRHGLSVALHTGVDPIQESGVVEAMTDEQYTAWLELADFLFGRPSCISLSGHGVLVARKP